MAASPNSAGPQAPSAAGVGGRRSDRRRALGATAHLLVTIDDIPLSPADQLHLGGGTMELASSDDEMYRKCMRKGGDKIETLAKRKGKQLTTAHLVAADMPPLPRAGTLPALPLPAATLPPAGTLPALPLPAATMAPQQTAASRPTAAAALALCPLRRRRRLPLRRRRGRSRVRPRRTSRLVPRRRGPPARPWPLLRHALRPCPPSSLPRRSPTTSSRRGRGVT